MLSGFFESWGNTLSGQKPEEKKDSGMPIPDASSLSALAEKAPMLMAAFSDKRSKKGIHMSPKLDKVLGSLREKYKHE